MLVHFLLSMQKKGTFLEISRHICDPDHIFSFIELVPTFTAIPPDPFHVLEGNNITLVWQYDLDGSFDDVVLMFINSSTTLTIVDKHDIKPRRSDSRKCLPGSHLRKHQCYPNRNYNLCIAEI